MNAKVATIGSAADMNRGHTTGFDYLRIFLALGVVFQHCTVEANPVSNRWINDNNYLWFFILPSFFALSGYLVVGSLVRTSALQFAILRVLRIIPALAVEVALSATILGAVFTDLSLSDYFSHQMFYAYFLNILGEIQFRLPGVFEGGLVNPQLWTIPYELKCYILLLGIGLLTLKIPILKPYFRVSLLFGALLITLLGTYNSDLYEIRLHASGRSLVAAFIWACVLYLYKEFMPYSGILAALSFGAGILMLGFDSLQFVAIPFIAYATVYVGILRLPVIPFGDLSYGVFLFHYPILQMLHIEFGIDNVFLLISFTVLASVLFALGSWNFVEDPILKRKKEILAYVTRLESRFTNSIRLSGH